MPVRAVDDFGETWDDPSRPELLKLLEEITESGGWLTVDRVEESASDTPEPQWMQVLWERDGRWAIDYRSGATQLQAHVTELQVAFDVLSDWIEQGRSWREALSWQQIR